MNLSYMAKRGVLLWFTLLIFFAGYSQVDKEFWFAPPDVTYGHGDRPVYLVISTLHDAADVLVMQPALNRAIAQVKVAANTASKLDLTDYIGSLETLPPARVLPTGIRITSSAPITAYYEIAAGANADIFALKGSNGLGNRFMIPAQDVYQNDPGWSPTPSASFDIVASQDNTVVKIIPTKPLVGHLADSIITIKLNAGETYSFTKPTVRAEDNPAGTMVESNKPIAITIKDDSIITGCADLIGDQLVPIEVAGREYVIVKGFLDIPEFVFITATEDNTQISVNGSTVPLKTLVRGEVLRVEITTKSTYILSNKTIYALHITGYGCEVGLAILPTINCRGSRQIGFSRSTPGFFGLNLLVQKGGIGLFTLNGSNTLIPASAFTPVNGTNGEWYTAQLRLGTSAVPVSAASLITNSQYSFQMGIINCTEATCSYGYFSSFSTLFIGDDLDFCQGGVITLDAGPGKESYLWSTGEVTQTIEVSTGGQYSVKVTREDCILYDTIRVTARYGTLDLGADVEICPGDTARIDGKEHFSWQWSNGSTAQFLHATNEGEYWLTVFDYTGCQASDTISVTWQEAPIANLGADILKCKTAEMIADATVQGATYLWHDGLTTASRIIREEGLYVVKLTGENGCSTTDSLRVENFPGPQQDSIFGSPSVCPFSTGIEYRVNPSVQSTYEWFVEGGTISSANANHLAVDWFDTNSAAMIKALITDDHGCKGDTLYYPVRINVVLEVEIPFGPDTLCVNKSQQIVYTTPVTNGSVYQWKVSGGEITSGQGSEEIIINWSEGLNALWIEETSVTIDTVCYGTSPELKVYVFKDTMEIILNVVSVDTSAAGRVHIGWRIEPALPLVPGEVSLLKHNQGEESWHFVASFPPGEETYDDDMDFAPDRILEYYLTVTNSCDEKQETAIHNTILLTGTADTTTELISLRWNHYSGWPEGVDHYEVWRKTNFDQGYKYLAAVPRHEDVFAAELTSDGFNHRYVIRAIQRSGTNESWSTPLAFKFEHTVTIPNIITPNGDLYNQHLYIDKIELYRNAELIILDRWGNEVYRTVHYKNDWDGRGLSPGVYFYILDLKVNNKVYKGTIQVLR